MQSACGMLLSFICDLSGSAVFFYSSSHGKIFEKKPLNKFVFWFSLQLLSETFLILKRIQRDMIINVPVYRSSCKVPVIFLDVTKLEYLRQILEKF